MPKTKESKKKSEGDSTPKNEVTIGELANIIGVSLRTAQRHTQSGLFKSVGTKGKAKTYDLNTCVQAYIAHVVAEVERKHDKNRVDELKTNKLEAEVKLKESQGQLHQLRTDIALGKYILIDDVKADYQRFFVVFKKFAMAIPSRIGGLIGGYVEPLVARGIEQDMQREINQMLRSFYVAGQAGQEGGAEQ